MHGKKDELPVERFGGYERREVHTGEMSLYFERIPAGFPPGGDEIYRGLPEEACQCPHWGYVFSGVVEYRYTDGRVDRVGPGDAFYIPPGHRWRCLEDAETVELSPTAPMEENSGRIAANIEELAARGLL